MSDANLVVFWLEVPVETVVGEASTFDNGADVTGTTMPSALRSHHSDLG